MSTLVIGDIHLMAGIILPLIEKQIKEEISHIVFTGDYTDQWGQNGNSRLYMKDLQFLLDWKKQREEDGIKVTCLLGNHDIPYIIERPVQYSLLFGDKRDHVKELILKLNPQVSCWSDDFLISHGGYLGDTKIEDWHQEPIPKHFNYAEHQRLWRDLGSIERDVGFCRGGSRNYGSPVWADAKEEFFHYPSKEYLNQCVGHRPVNEVMELSKDGAKLVVVDTFSLKRAPFWPYYHQISNNSGVVVLNEGKHKIMPIPEWNELPEETFIDYFEN